MLKPAFEAVRTRNSSSYMLRNFGEEAFSAPYHFHPEFELTLITGGEGKRYVGNRMEDFSAGDLVLLGANLPHCWKTTGKKDKNGRIKIAGSDPGAVVIQFTENFLGKDFISSPELKAIHALLLQCKNGLQFSGQTRSDAEEKIRSLAEKKDHFEKMIGLLQLLQQLALSQEHRPLAPRYIAASSGRDDQQRINPVLSYIQENYRDKISLEQAAQIAHMSVNAFCKYFKKITRQTFMGTVIEYRLNDAVRQLVQTDLPVTDICFKSGFGDISHFNKTFKSKMQESPLQYRKRFLGENR